MGSHFTPREVEGKGTSKREHKMTKYTAKTSTPVGTIIGLPKEKIGMNTPATTTVEPTADQILEHAEETVATKRVATKGRTRKQVAADLVAADPYLATEDKYDAADNALAAAELRGIQKGKEGKHGRKAKNEPTPEAAPAVTVQKFVSLILIRIDQGTQIRSKLDPDTVESYALDMADLATKCLTCDGHGVIGEEGNRVECSACGGQGENSPFPPLEVVQTPDDMYILWDGFHRLLAAQKAGYGKFLCNVTPGTKRDAVRLSLGANGDVRALPRTNKDKRNAVLIALKDSEWKTYSLSMIAELCKVGGTLVSTIVKEQEQAAAELPDTTKRPTVRVGRDGRAQKVGKIGSKTALNKAKKSLASAPKAVSEAAKALIEREVERQGLDEPTPAIIKAGLEVGSEMAIQGKVTIHTANGEPIHADADTPVEGAKVKSKSPIKLAAADAAMIEQQAEIANRHSTHRNGLNEPAFSGKVQVFIDPKSNKIAINGPRMLLVTDPSDTRPIADKNFPFADLLKFVEQQIEKGEPYTMTIKAWPAGQSESKPEPITHPSMKAHTPTTPLVPSKGIFAGVKAK
jgi:uncharacterized ParB-like nuclease family protein